MMLSFALALFSRSTLLCMIEKSLRLFHAFMAFFFSLCSLTLAVREKMGKMEWVLLGALLFLIMLGIFVRHKRGSRHMFLKASTLMLFLIALSAQIALSGYVRAKEEAPLIKIVMPGVKKDDAHLVQLFSVEGSLLGEYFLEGDLVSVRAKVIRIKPLFAFLGFSNLCKIDSLSPGYLRPDLCCTDQAGAHALSYQRGFFLEKIWEEIFFEKAYSLWINSALMQASFFPLIDRAGKAFSGSFMLTLTRSGLSSLAIAEEKL